MSLHYELNTDRPLQEVVNQLRKGRLGRVVLGPVNEAGQAFAARWEHGLVSANMLDEESKDSVRQECGMVGPETRVWFHCKPRVPGADEAVEMAVALLDALAGDLVFIHGSGGVCFQRMNGRLILYRNELEDPWMALFKRPYEIKSACEAL